MKNVKQFMMFGLTVLCLLAVGYVTPVSAQDDSPIFYVAEYMKTKPGMNADYLKVEKVWQKIHEARQKAGNIHGWTLHRVLMPAGTNTEYNYVAVTVYKGNAQLGNHFKGDWYENMKFDELLSKEEMAIFDKTGDTRDIVKSEVWQGRDGVFADDKDYNPRYMVFNFMKVKEGHTTSEYGKAEVEMYKPLHAAKVKANVMEGWGLYSMNMPYGTNMPYHAATIDAYENFEDINAPLPEGMFEKVFPGKDGNNMYEKIAGLRDLLKAELREPVYRVDW